MIFTPKELKTPVTLEKLILRLERYLAAIGTELLSKRGRCPKKLSTFIEKLKILKAKYANAESVDTFKTVLLQGVLEYQKELEKFLTKQNEKALPCVKNLYSIILAGAEAARVYILPKGCIEHYYVRSNIQFMPVSGKDKLFHEELKHILASRPKIVRQDYAQLIAILEKALQ